MHGLHIGCLLEKASPMDMYSKHRTHTTFIICFDYRWFYCDPNDTYPLDAPMTWP